MPGDARVKLSASEMRQVDFVLAAARSKNISQHIENQLCRLLAAEGLGNERVQQQVGTIMADRVADWELNSTGADEIARDSLANAWLRNCLVRFASAEILFTRLRRQLLEATIDQQDLDDDCLELMFSIAAQCYRVEYAWYQASDETQHVAELDSRLAGMVDQARSDLTDCAQDLLAILMYRSPNDIDYANTLVETNSGESNPTLAEFVQEIITHHAEESLRTDRFVRQAELVDDVSERVSDMYLANPYPRWTNADFHDQGPAKAPWAVAQGLTQAPNWRESGMEVESVLVAGCGTGLHPILMAKTFPACDFTAIDISARSLAYAEIMAERYGVTNIRFERCDIQSLSSWDRQFDFVDSMGVIHHMHDPEAGLRALLTRLKPGKVLRLGLYSKRARETIQAFRDRHPVDRLAVDHELIRRLRHEMLTENSDPAYEHITNSRDFYSLSGFRDMLLHEQEHQFTLPGIAELLERNGLTFLRFMLEPNILAGLRFARGEEASPYDLDAWQKAEERLPLLFIQMYNFFAQRTD